MITATAVESIPALVRPETVELAATSNKRMLDLLSSLDDEEWGKPTDCSLWDVRALASHVLGGMEAFSAHREFMRQMRAGAKAAGGGEFVDGLTSVQVREYAGLTHREVLARMAAAGPRSAQWRGRRRFMRSIPMANSVGGVKEKWRGGYLFDVILTRDTWMHRVDIARATGRPVVLTPDHDGRIVADVVAEWARRHGQPFTLHLDGPVGGMFAAGSGGEDITIDAVEFCRILSGRAIGAGLLTTEVPF